MITLRLQGSLAAHVRDRLDEEAKRRSKPGEAVLELDARSVTEAMRLVAGQAEGMDWELRLRSWRVTVNGELISQAELDMRLPDRAYVSVAPVLAGDGPSIPLWGKVLIYLGGAIAAGEYLASQIPSIPDTEHLETGQRRTLFSGPVNSVAQGGAVPLIYGRTRVGSTVVSGGITQERPTGGDHASPDEIGLGGARPAGADVDRRDVDRGEEDRLAHLQPGAASRERSVLRVVDLLGEGEIEGLVDGLKSVFIDGVAVEDADGNKNVEGVSIQERKGLAHNATGQEALTGFDATSTGLTHRRQKIVHGTPQVGTVPAAYDAARVTLQFPVLVEYDEHGNEIATDVQIKIEAGRSGSWTTVLTQTISDLSLDVQEVAWRVDRPANVTDSQTWQVRVSRLTADSTSTKVRDDVYWQRFAGLRDVKQTYPHSAVIGLVVETDRADSVNVSRREYEVEGRKVLVPPAAIYDPSTATSTSAATYGSGVWDGTMRRLWTDNPAWIAYDALTDRRAGLGGIPGMVEAVRGARAFFLELSRHCDELVPAPDSAADMEPRWRFNGTIQRREQARRVIDWLLSACRAGISWSAGAAALSIDGESDVVASIGNANVVDGEFDYQGLRWQERYSAAAVTWQDPEDEYRSGIELVVSDDLVAKYGYRQKDVAAVGCTSRGQAHRTGLLVLNEQERESETVKFRMALEGMHLRPGDRIQIADQQRFEVRAAFRVKAVDTSTAGRETITLDSESPRLASGGTIAFGEGETAAVTQEPDEGADVLRTTDVPTGLVRGDLVVNDAAAIDWIVSELTERDQLEAVLSARRHDPNKYSSIELRRMLSPPLVDPVARILPPAAVTVIERTYEDGNLVRSQLEIAVRESSPADHRIDQVEYQIQRPKRRATPEEIAGGDWSVLPRGRWEPLRLTDARSIVEKNVALGGYRVRARFRGGKRRSEWTLSAELVADGKTDAIAAPTGLTAVGRYEGYWIDWTRPAAADYAYTEIWQRAGNPGAADADVDLTQTGWVQVGESAGRGFLQTGVRNTDPLRVAIRHRDTSGLYSVAREVGVTPLALDAAAGEDGLGFEYIHRATNSSTEPTLPGTANAWGFDRPVLPFTDGLNLTSQNPVGHRWRRPWAGTPATGESPYETGTTTFKDGVGPWEYEGIVGRLGYDPPAPVAVTSSISYDNSDQDDPVSTWSAGLTRASAELGALLQTVQRYSAGSVREFVRVIAADSNAWVNNVFSERALTRADRSTGTAGAHMVSAECQVMTFRDFEGDRYRSGPVLTVATGSITGGTPPPAGGKLASPTLTAAPGNAKVVVSWPNVTNAASYQRRHKRSSAASYGSWVSATSPQNFGGLANGVSYDFQIRAVPATDSSYQTSDPTTVTATPQATTVTANAGSNKSVASGGTVGLDGSATVQNGAGATTYAWSRVTGTGGSLSSNSAASPTFTAPTLSPGAANRVIVWRLTATNNGVSDTDDVSVTVQAPNLGSPSLSGSAGDGRATLSWTAVTGATGYQRRHKRSSAQNWGSWAAASNTRTQVFGGLSNGVSYDFQVRAVSATKNGPPSNTRTLTPTGSDPDPTTVTANAGSNKTVASGGSVRLDGSATVQNGAGSTTYRWARVSGTGGSLSSSSVASPTFRAPTLAAGARDVVIVWELTVTNNGVSDSDEVEIEVTAPGLTAPPTPPSLSGSLTQSAPGQNAVGTASWGASARATGYELEHYTGVWERSGSGYGDVGNVLTSAVSFATGTGVDLVGNNQAHRVRAYNAAGSSGWRQVDFQVSRS